AAAVEIGQDNHLKQNQHVEESAETGDAEHADLNKAQPGNGVNLWREDNREEGYRPLDDQEVPRAGGDTVNNRPVIIFDFAERRMVENALIKTLVALEEVGFHREHEDRQRRHDGQ